MPTPKASIALGLLLAAFCCEAGAFDFDDVSARARKLASEPYVKRENRLPQELRDITYDQYRDIRFKPERGLWRGSRIPFEVQFFHMGLYFEYPVYINLFDSAGVRRIPFNAADFDYGRLNNFDPTKFGDIGYAGFRLHYPMNNSEYRDEVSVFLGASYFRALPAGARYGMSARGLAVDTAEMSGEEFPAFTEYWIEWPPAGAKELEIYALLESPRVTGAYRFVVRPGRETTMDVQLRLFPRVAGAKLGIAPLTSMYLFGENQRQGVDDYRPEVHDSDGLMVETAHGEWLWRPLVNPRRLIVTSFALENPRGFGLMQRDRNYANYEDLEARYDLRPSTWIVPKGDWGKGRVELVLIPTPDETNDNIVAYWVPEQPAAQGQQIDLQYRIGWQHGELRAPPLAHVVQTRRGHGWKREADDSIQMMVDFQGEELAKLGADAKVTGVVWVGDNGELIEKQAYRNEATGGWRLAIRLRQKDPNQPVEMRGALQGEGAALSETWTYLLPPSPPP